MPKQVKHTVDKQPVATAQSAIHQIQKLEQEIIEEPQHGLPLTDKQLKNQKNKERKKERKHRQWLEKQELEKKQSPQPPNDLEIKEKQVGDKIRTKLLLEVPRRWLNILEEIKQQNEQISQNESPSVLKNAQLKFISSGRSFSYCQKPKMEEAKRSLSTRERTLAPPPKQKAPLIQYEEYYINESLRNKTQEQIRRKLDSLFKQRHKIKREINVHILADFQRLSERKDAINEEMMGYKQALKVKIIRKCIQNHPTFVDVHYLRKEEIRPLLEAMSKALAFEASNRSERVPVEKIQGKKYCHLTMKIGMGNNSKVFGEPDLMKKLDEMEEYGEVEIIERRQDTYVLRILLPEN